jgi:two-component system sensor histidine kinase BaeS
MSERLEVSDTRRRAFLADVAHELRTPLTIMQGQLEAIGDGVYAADPEHIEVLLGHTRQMARLVEDLRTISLAEVGALRLDPQPTDVVALAHEVVAAYRSAASARDTELLVEAPMLVEGLADAAALRRVLGNLVSNAIRHTATGGHVRILVEPASATVGPAITVSDDGEGMSVELVIRAFERFEKGPGSDGSGLGLPIARDLIEAQGGHIELQSSPGMGTTARLQLAIAENEVSD